MKLSTSEVLVAPAICGAAAKAALNSGASRSTWMVFSGKVVPLATLPAVSTTCSLTLKLWLWVSSSLV
ncbi:hypothetical protein D9M68_649210 [compost metagenome]